MRVRSASWVFAAQVFAKAVAFPISIVLARALGPSGKGSLALVQLVTATAVLVCNPGLGSAILYYAGRREVRGRDAVKLAWGYGALLVGVLAILYLMFGTAFTASVLHTSSTLPLALAIVLVAPALATNLMYSLTVGSGSVRDATMVGNVSLTAQLFIYGTLFVTGNLTLPATLAIWGVTSVLEAIAYTVLGSRAKAKEDVAPGARTLFVRMRGYGLIMWVTGLVGFAALRIDMYLLGILKGASYVGVYSIAVTFAELCWFIPSALSAVMLPKIASEGEEALEISLRIERTLWSVTLAAGIAILAVAAVVIPLLYGSAFGGATLALALLLPGMMAIAISTVPVSYLSGTGRPIEHTKASAANLVVNVIANLILIPRLGIAGAAISSSISYSVSAVMILTSFRRATGVGLRAALWPSKADFVSLASASLSVLRRET